MPKVKTNGSTPSSAVKYNRQYRPEWEDDPALKGWLAPCEDDESRAVCLVCRCKLRVHHKDLVEHSKTKKHIRAINGQPPDDFGEDGTVTIVCDEFTFAAKPGSGASAGAPTRRSRRYISSKRNSSISRFPIPKPEILPKDLKQLMDENKEKAGFVPNVFRVLSHRPEEMRAFVNYYDAVMIEREGGHLTKADKEMIIVAVSSKNNCRYCIVAHSALFRIFSKDPILADQVAANWETADLTERQRAILTFAMRVTDCQPVRDEHFKDLQKHGLDKEDAWDIGSVVALFSLSNRMAYLTSMVPNEEFYMMGRTGIKRRNPEFEELEEQEETVDAGDMQTVEGGEIVTEQSMEEIQQAQLQDPQQAHEITVIHTQQ